MTNPLASPEFPESATPVRQQSTSPARNCVNSLESRAAATSNTVWPAWSHHLSHTSQYPSGAELGKPVGTHPLHLLWAFLPPSPLHTTSRAQISVSWHLCSPLGLPNQHFSSQIRAEFSPASHYVLPQHPEVQTPSQGRVSGDSNDPTWWQHHAGYKGCRAVGTVGAAPGELLTTQGAHGNAYGHSCRVQRWREKRKGPG